MGSAPSLPKSVVDAARRYDRMLDILWCPKRDRFTLVRFRPEAHGAYHEIHVFEGELGEFVMPNENLVLEWLKSGDVASCPGLTFQDKIRNYIGRQNRRNRDIREKADQGRREQNVSLLGEYLQTARQKNGNFEDTQKYMAERKEVKEAAGE